MVFWITENLGVIAEGELYPPGVVIFNVSDLIDGVNNPERIASKINDALTLLETNPKRRVIFQCHAGVSRSPTMAAATLAKLKGVDFDIALGEVAHKCPRTQYNYDLVDSCRKALKEVV